MQSFALFGSLLLGLLPSANAATAWQNRNLTYQIPDTPVTTFASTNFTSKSDALSALQTALGNATIATSGDLSYGSTIARVWTKQRRTYPDAIVYPETPEHVSILMQFYSNNHPLWTDGFAIMGGGHADFGGAQSPSIIIDLQKLGSTEIVTIPPSNSSEYAILKIGGGSEAGDVYDTLDGTGWAFLGPRAASIGVGGFLLGGGIAFQTNRYGVGADSLVGIEVVLINGTIIYANPYNEHSDLFWAATGGGWLGFGVVTNFYIQAYPDPGTVYVGTIAWGEDKADEVFNKTAAWWESNTDPDAFPALLYYLKDPTEINALVPIKDRQFSMQLNALRFGGSEADFNNTFGHFYENADGIILQTYTLKTLQQYLLTNYPYGYNRLFYGKSHTNSTPEFYQNTFEIYKETVNGMLERGEDPGHTLWVDEYVFPAWNGAGPDTDSATSWPHSTSAHITLTSGEWSNDSTTEWLYSQDENKMMAYLRDFQNGLDEPAIYDYPNYIAPYSKTEELWGAENFKKLLQIKEKYDPECLFNRGRVIATEACIAKGLSNTSI
ncbi:putative FAD-linked oxidoreductase YgaK [Lasiodiplodia hormozganensis]|uniref:FAD-linked oxidoreductase YgaK n=1 Tax=Lasiodiplodia hormozganensis TaxID=869390 RepID=A0AA39YCR5_9PEZI|nr:putative FAD-linked oxidoreductase YgaK [Lasiodiplodia hormozganensis]